MKKTVLQRCDFAQRKVRFLVSYFAKARYLALWSTHCMISLDRYRKHALALSETTEVEHFGMLAMQRGKQRFAAFDPKKGVLSLKLALTDPVRAEGITRGVLAPAPGKYGAEGWTSVDLERLEWDEFVGLLDSAHALAVPKRRGKG